MALLLGVPVTNDVPWYFFKVTLSNVVYTLRMRYNPRMSRWIMDVADASNNDILLGIPVLILRDLLGQYVMVGLPIGIFFSTDDTDQDTQPTRNSFGIDHTLWYLDPLQPAPAL